MKLVTECIKAGNHHTLDPSIDEGKWFAVKGETSSWKLWRISNCEDVRPTKCFVRVESFIMFSYGMLLTILGAWGFERVTSLPNIIVSTLEESVYLQNTICEPWSTTKFPVTEFLYTWRTSRLSYYQVRPLKILLARQSPYNSLVLLHSSPQLATLSYSQVLVLISVPFPLEHVRDRVTQA